MWLLQEGPNAKKHKGWMHPVSTFIVHYSVVATAVPLAHDNLIGAVSNKFGAFDGMECTASREMIQRRKAAAGFFAVYYLVYFCARLAIKWKEKPHLLYSEFYGQTFMCSVTIAMSVLSFYTNRPLIAQAFCVAVGIDQLLWYVDILGFLLRGKFPIGVCKYLFKPGTSWMSRITSSHHLWTIPLVLWLSGGAFHWLALPLAFFVVPVNAISSRLMTPVAIRNPGKGDETVSYLNINLSHEMWEDVQVGLIRICENSFPYLVRLVFWWCIMCTLVFAFLNGISRVIANGASPSVC